MRSPTTGTEAAEAAEAGITQIGVALARLDVAAKNDGIEPGTYLWGWTETQRDLVEAMYGVERRREARMEEQLATAKATAEANAEAMRLQVEAMHLERRKVDRLIEQAKISLGEKESTTVQALVDSFTDKARDVMVVRARAWSQTRYLQTGGALALVGFLLFGIGCWAGTVMSSTGAPSDFLQQCVGSLQKDPRTGQAFCAVQVQGQGR